MTPLDRLVKFAENSVGSLMPDVMDKFYDQFTGAVIGGGTATGAVSCDPPTGRMTFTINTPGVVGGNGTVTIGPNNLGVSIVDEDNEIQSVDDFDPADALADAIEGVGNAVCNMFDQFGGDADASADVAIDGSMYRVCVSVTQV